MPAHLPGERSATSCKESPSRGVGPKSRWRVTLPIPHESAPPMIAQRLFLLALAIAAAIVPLTVLADPPARVGRVSLLEGPALLRLDRQDAGQAASLNWPIAGGAILDTDPGSRAEVWSGPPPSAWAVRPGSNFPPWTTSTSSSTRARARSPSPCAMPNRRPKPRPTPPTAASASTAPDATASTSAKAAPMSRSTAAAPRSAGATAASR